MVMACSEVWWCVQFYRTGTGSSFTTTESNRQQNDEQNQLQYHKRTVQQHAYPIHQAKADGVCWSR